MRVILNRQNVTYMKNKFYSIPNIASYQDFYENNKKEPPIKVMKKYLQPTITQFKLNLGGRTKKLQPSSKPKLKGILKKQKKRLELKDIFE